MQLAVEAIVDAVDPRLRGVSRYQSKIAPGAERTIAHLRALARELPEPIEFSRAAWSSDPLLNAFFATAADLPALLGRSEELRAFFAAPANAAVTEVHALLGMLKTERNVFAPAFVNGALQQDVAQTTVSFDKHRLFAPAAELLDCRRQVGMLILRRLAVLALERITALGERATELEQRKAVLGSRLRMLSLRRNGIDAIAGGDRPIGGNRVDRGRTQGDGRRLPRGESAAWPRSTRASTTSRRSSMRPRTTSASRAPNCA